MLIEGSWDFFDQTTHLWQHQAFKISVLAESHDSAVQQARRDLVRGNACCLEFAATEYSSVLVEYHW